MVESGLILNTSVSHYRLSLHLFFAFLILSFLIWNYFKFKHNKKKNFFNFKNKLTPVKFIYFNFISNNYRCICFWFDAGMIYQTL